MSEGNVFVWYQGPNGGEATGSLDDVLYRIGWWGLSNWITTAGITTDLVSADSNAVIEAYPNAVVTYDYLGRILSVGDKQLGISVTWRYNFYFPPTITIYVFMEYDPGLPPEPTPDVVRSSYLNLVEQKKIITATIVVDDNKGTTLSGATVSGFWTFPDGTTKPVTGDTNEVGVVQYEFKLRKYRGLIIFTITDILLDGYLFDEVNSVLSDSIEV
jgi:hypothetical protein